MIPGEENKFFQNRTTGIWTYLSIMTLAGPSGEVAASCSNSLDGRISLNLKATAARMDLT